MILRPNYILSGRYFSHKQILQFPRTNELITDEDIFNLFAGMIRLVKKSAEAKVESKYMREIKILKDRIRMLEKA